MKNFLKRTAVVLAAWALVACGGGSDGGQCLYTSCQTDTSTGAVSTATSVDVVSSSSQVGSAAGEEVTVTAYVNGAGNAALGSAPVTFSTDSGVLSGIASTTDSTGAATAKFRSGSNKAMRIATVLVTSGGVSSSVQIEITGNAATLSGPSTVALNAAATYTVKVVDSKGGAIAGQAVAVSSQLGNGLQSSTLTTSSGGTATINYTALRSGSDTLTVTSAGATATVSISISGEDFTVVTPVTAAGAATEVAIGSGQTVSFRYYVNGAPQSGVLVSFATTGGTVSPSSVQTDSSGLASTVVRAGTAGPVTVQANLPNNLARASAALEFVAVTPSALVLQVSPSALAPNVNGGTAQQADVVAKVTDTYGNPVKNVSVNFSRDADPSGGNLSQPSAVTDSNGLAKVQYIAGGQSTSNGGVKLRAAVGSNLSVSGEATLTVNQQSLFPALGTGNVISNFDDQTYSKDWTVYVTDSNGVRVPGVTLTMSLLPSKYRKGRLGWNGSVWQVATSLECANEDLDHDGIRLLAEDTNGNGILDPGNVISLVNSNVVTDSTGRATVTLRYAESYAPWVEVVLQAKAVVNGTESKKTATFYVSGLTTDFNKEDTPPAGLDSPFGTDVSAGGCTRPN